MKEKKITSFDCSDLCSTREPTRRESLQVCTRNPPLLLTRILERIQMSKYSSVLTKSFSLELSGEFDICRGVSTLFVPTHPHRDESFGIVFLLFGKRCSVMRDLISVG